MLSRFFYLTGDRPTDTSQPTGGRMSAGNAFHRDSGHTVIDVMVCCAALLLLGCMVLPALSKERDDARIAECADHLKQLGQAAHQYAADFEGKFFYNRDKKIDHRRVLRPEIVGMWYDPERVGRYIGGDLMYVSTRPKGRQFRSVTLDPPENPPPDWPHRGLGGGAFLCPADAEGAGRSYEMNYWAGTGTQLHPDEAIPYLGEPFDSSSEHLDQLLLFSEAMSLEKTATKWVTRGRFGSRFLPGQRFGGIKGRLYLISDPTHGRRFNLSVLGYPSYFDYVRHGANKDRTLAEGAVNITYADGSVFLRSHTDLYSDNPIKSTYQTLWSLNDQEVELSNWEKWGEPNKEPRDDPSMQEDQ